MPVPFYDNLALNDDIVLDWPFTEGGGSLVHDVSKSGIIGTLHGAAGIMWPAAIGSGFYGIYLFETWHQYATALAADTGNLNFTSGDYSLSCWVNWLDQGESQILIGKYAVDIRGWEAYITKTSGVDYMTVRHHHGGTRTASYSSGWSESTLHLFGYSRSGGWCQHYRNGLPIPTTISAGGLQDPTSSAASNLVMGSRFTLNDNWLFAYIGRPRVWARELSANEHSQLFAQGNAQ